MFERFTQPARAAVIQAQAEARALHHPQIGTEHLLLGLLADPASGIAELTGLDHDTVVAEVRRHRGTGTEPAADRDQADAAALRAIGIDLDAVRRAIEENFGPGALQLPPPAADRPKQSWWQRSSGHIPFTPRAKKCLELALREAIRLKHNHIGAEHLLLGILRDNGGPGARLLARDDAARDRLREAVETSLRTAA